MKILAIDTSNWPLGVALMENHRIIGEFNTYISKNHSLRLMPAVEQLMKQTGVQPKELSGIAVAQGPGSYTGVRIGVTTAKTLAWTLQIPIVGISSLQVIAQNRPYFSGIIIPIFDARRGQVYRGSYRWDVHKEKALPLASDRLQLVSELIEEYQAGEDKLLFIGEGVKVHQQALQEGLGERALFARESEHLPRAAELALLASYYWELRTDDIHAFAPEYLQLAEAEAKWLTNQGGTC